MNVKNGLLNGMNCMAFLSNPSMVHWLKYGLDFQAMRENSDKSLIITKDGEVFSKNNILIGAIFDWDKKIYS